MAACNTETLYDTLKVNPSASSADIKAAYHRALLTSHPDKYPRLSDNEKALETPPTFDISALKHAYLTLSDHESRAAYDASLSHSQRLRSNGEGGGGGPRPAQVISFDDFVESEAPPQAPSLMHDNASMSSYVTFSVAGAHEKPKILHWTHRCRCGGEYCISEEDLEEDRHLIACERCSEVVYVGYEIVEEL